MVAPNPEISERVYNLIATDIACCSYTCVGEAIKRANVSVSDDGETAEPSDEGLPFPLPADCLSGW